MSYPYLGPEEPLVIDIPLDDAVERTAREYIEVFMWILLSGSRECYGGEE